MAASAIWSRQLNVAIKAEAHRKNNCKGKPSQKSRNRGEVPSRRVVARAEDTQNEEQPLAARLVSSKVDTCNLPLKTLLDMQLAYWRHAETRSSIKSELQKRQQLQDRVLKGYYTQRVIAAIASYASLYLKRGDCNTVKLLFDDKPSEAARAEAALASVSSSISTTEFAACLDAAYAKRDCAMFVYTPLNFTHMSWIMHDLCSCGVPEFLEDELPLKCMILKHHSVFVELL